MKQPLKRFNYLMPFDVTMIFSSLWYFCFFPILGWCGWMTLLSWEFDYLSNSPQQLVNSVPWFSCLMITKHFLRNFRRCDINEFWSPTNKSAFYRNL
ncbi:MAG: hypothetical protein [Circoviridae sp.]|nr:MAG: hypothetical protein [Circoviridae sp.]